VALSETLKNILETMATSPFQDEAGVAGVAESGSTALTMTSAATPEVERGCGSSVAHARLPHQPQTECQKRVAEQPLDTLGVTEIATPATPATPATRVCDARQPLRELWVPLLPKVQWCRHVWHHADRVSSCQACGVRVPTLPEHDASEADSSPGGSYGS
jgi:hypothetical protein